MITIDYITLVANAFIELNKFKEVRKIYLEDIKTFNNILKEELLNRKIEYIEHLDIIALNEIRFNYNIFFNLYEDYDGWVVTLANGINPVNIENYFRRNDSEILLKILETINFNEIFKTSKRLKYVHFT